MPRLALGTALPVALAVTLGATASCGRGEEPAPPPGGSASAPGAPGPGPAAPQRDRIIGTLFVGGAPLRIHRCRPGREQSIYVDLVTSRGALRFLAYEDRTMYWNPVPESSERGAPLACTDLRRSWGGGTREDGSTYFRGQIVFSCRGEIGAVSGELEVDCGNITPLERELLDENRRRKREELDAARPPAGAAPGPR